MLLITRRADESVIINDTIEIKIVDIRGGRVKLGFEYPEGNSVYRKELYLKIQEENRAAAGIKADKLQGLLKTLGQTEKKDAES